MKNKLIQNSKPMTNKEKLQKNKKRKIIIFFIVIILLLSSVIALSHHNKKYNQSVRASILSREYHLAEEEGDIPSYGEYLSRMKEIGPQDPTLGDEILVMGKDYYESSLKELSDQEDGSVTTGSTGSISYQIDVKESGMYHIEVGYYPTADSNTAIIRNLYINGELPFQESEGLTFQRMWVDSNKDFLMNVKKNQATPGQIQNPEWTSMKLESADKSVSGPFQYYLKKGNNILTLESVKSTLEISYIKLIPVSEVPDYTTYLNHWEKNGAKRISDTDITGGAICIQGEDTYYKSNGILLPENDRSSALTVPYHSSNIVLNTIGGSAWSEVGLSISWKVKVEQSGLYRIAARFMQTENRDFYSLRELKVNGAIPFSEAAELKFYYDSRFQIEYFGDQQGAYYFYLEEGDNLLTMTVSLGDLSYVVTETVEAVKNFNALYRRLVAVMGSDPDDYRDYDIVSLVPDMEDILLVEYHRLTKVMESLGDTIESSTKTREISKMLLLLEKIIRKPDRISRELKNYNDNITAISEWMLALGRQPLTIDYLLICGEGYDLPKAEGNIFQQLVHKAKAFIGSFTNDYTIELADSGQKEKVIEVWMAATRDQYDIAQRLVNNAFAGKDFGVELKMVSAETVMPASLTGNGPDVAIQLNYTMPSNFAYRNAAYDLSGFPDFEEVKDRFSAGAMEYLEYQGGYYGLPDLMSFPVLYYRKDILDKMGLSIPDTWEELSALIPFLQAENMDIYFVTTGHTVLGGYSSTVTKPVNSIFLSMLYQNGQALYSADGKSTNLDSLDSLLTFKKWTEYYTKEGFDLTMSVVTRFRTGEVPVIIEDYSYINSINAAAPEIDGAWSIAPLPGTMAEDGTINRSTACMVGSAMMLKAKIEENDSADESWEFLKWWTSKEVQLQYATELKALLGDAANYPIANVEALKELNQELGFEETIEETLSWLRGTPQIPGGYITGRSVENAFLAVIDKKLNAVDTLYAQIRYINEEIKNKREEFDLEP
ncbi:ABC-type glycerol-3-phosphate transport system substrate-binding protein/uncharacterized short protein YbdD (DUF466 family) [Anaerotaenia torta]|uniref:extracellular solute-binding protein n=1 Tax=Anaerotaenia torta TaxID=433293 RepID=UPI003D2528AC